VQFDLVDGCGGTDLRWTLYVDEPPPDATLFKHMCHRIGELINANLRYTYGR
jgi:hypothetical protein